MKSGAKPGTKEFRAALRNALEGTKGKSLACTASSTCPPLSTMASTIAAAMLFMIRDGKWALATK